MATTAAPYGFWATNPTKKLAHWVYLLGQPLSRNRVFQNNIGPRGSSSIIISSTLRHTYLVDHKFSQNFDHNLGIPN